MVLIMSKKKVFFIFLLVIMMSLFPNFVSASSHPDGAGLGEAFDTIRELFIFLPDLVTLEKLIGGDTAALFWAKFLVWILLFAALYFGASVVFKDNKRIAVVVSIVISLMGTLLIPSSILVNIFQTYGLVAGIVVWTIPLVAGMYIAHKFENPFARAIIYGTAAWILFSINETIVKAQGVLNTKFPFFGLLLAVVIILFFWNLGAIFGMVGGGGIGSAVGGIGNWLTGRGGDGRDDDEGDGHRESHRERQTEREERRLEDLEQELEQREDDLRRVIEENRDDEIERLRAIAGLIAELDEVQIQLRRVGL